MSKILRVGDPHIKISNLEESNRLINFIIQVAMDYNVDRVEFMGDMFHTHAVIRMEVLEFWRRAFTQMTNAGLSVLTLVGNHDQPGSREKESEMSSLSVFKDIIDVIDKPIIYDNIAYIPYMSDRERFLREAQKLYDREAKELLIAHQTFTGATYENGFYAEDGIDPALVPQKHIVSGHIHKQQEIGKCFYLGTPKWDTMSDANENKGIWLYEHNKDGSVKSKEFISTESVVTPIKKYVVYEGEEVPELSSNARNYLEFHGKTAWISKMKSKYKGLASIKAKPVDRKIGSIDKDKKISLFDFLNDHFVPIDGVKKQDINEYLKTVTYE